ncbi:hypothetical protein SHAL103562_00690 [Shewanella algae]
MSTLFKRNSKSIKGRLPNRCNRPVRLHNGAMYPLTTIRPLYPLTGTHRKMPTDTGTVNGYDSITKFGARYLTGAKISIPNWPYSVCPSSAPQLEEVQP